MEILQRTFDDGQADVSDGFCDRFERLFQKLIVDPGDGLFGVEYGGEVERDAYVDVHCIRKDCFQVKSNLLTTFRFTTYIKIMILN